MKVVEQDLTRIAATAGRRKLLDPNKDSDVKVERYTFALSKKIILGEPTHFQMRNQPDVSFRPQEITVNVPWPGMFYIVDFRIANVSCTVGGRDDAFNWHKKKDMDCPMMHPANSATASIEYTGYVPPEWRQKRRLSRLELMISMHEALRESDVSMSHAILKAAVEGIPQFEFCLSITGPASIVA